MSNLDLHKLHEAIGTVLEASSIRPKKLDIFVDKKSDGYYLSTREGRGAVFLKVDSPKASVIAHGKGSPKTVEETEITRTQDIYNLALSAGKVYSTELFYNYETYLKGLGKKDVDGPDFLQEPWIEKKLKLYLSQAIASEVIDILDKEFKDLKPVNKFDTAAKKSWKEFEYYLKK